MQAPGSHAARLIRQHAAHVGWMSVDVLPCFNGSDTFCKEAWEGIATILELSPRQVEIACGVLADQSDKEIAVTLGVSTCTAQTYLARLREKLEVGSRMQIAMKIVAAYLAWRIKSPPPTGCP